MEHDGGMRPPWLSVLIPAYGVERYLRACVGSVLAQAGEGVEILVLDDASPDRGGQIAARLHARHPGVVRALAHAQNRGLSGARNSLLAAARGRYVWFLDADDVLLPGAVAGLRGIVDADAPDLVLCDFSLLRERSGWRHRLRGEHHRRSHAGDGGRLSRDRDALARGMLRSRQLHAWSKIAKREVWSQAPFPEGRYFEDMAAIPSLLAAARTWRHAPRAWVGYRQRDDSIVATMTPRKVHDLLASLRELHEGVVQPPGGVTADVQSAADYFCLRTFANLARNLPPDDAALHASCRAAMAAIFPAGPAWALQDCRRRGWWLRAHRAQRSLTRCGWMR